MSFLNASFSFSAKLESSSSATLFLPLFKAAFSKRLQMSAALFSFVPVRIIPSTSKEKAFLKSESFFEISTSRYMLFPCFLSFFKKLLSAFCFFAEREPLFEAENAFVFTNTLSKQEEERNESESSPASFCSAKPPESEKSSSSTALTAVGSFFALCFCALSVKSPFTADGPLFCVLMYLSAKIPLSSSIRAQTDMITILLFFISDILWFCNSV